MSVPGGKADLALRTLTSENDPKRTMSRISAALAVSAILSTTADLFCCWRVVSDAPPVGASDR